MWMTSTLAICSLHHRNDSKGVAYQTRGLMNTATSWVCTSSHHFGAVPWLIHTGTGSSLMINIQARLLAHQGQDGQDGMEISGGRGDNILIAQGMSPSSMEDLAHNEYLPQVQVS